MNQIIFITLKINETYNEDVHPFYDVLCEGARVSAEPLGCETANLDRHCQSMHVWLAIRIHRTPAEVPNPVHPQSPKSGLRFLLLLVV